MEKELRPYELQGAKYALWFDCGQLGINTQVAVAAYLCGRARSIVLPHGQLDERTRNFIRGFAIQRRVLLPKTIFE